MQLIGENISSSEPDIDAIIDEKDASSLIQLAKKQIDWGSTKMLAINCATRMESEPSDIVWITKTIQKELPIALCFDSANPEAQKAGLSAHTHGRAMVNSITGEPESIAHMLPLVKKYHATVTALLHDESGMPGTVEDRLEIIPSIIAHCREFSIAPEDIYFDAMVFPLATDDHATRLYLETVQKIRELYPEYRTICGLNNISYGLPEEDLLNTGFLTMCSLIGQDAVYVALSEAIAAYHYGVTALLGQDTYLMDYISAYRDQRLIRLV